MAKLVITINVGDVIEKEAEIEIRRCLQNIFPGRMPIIEWNQEKPEEEEREIEGYTLSQLLEMIKCLKTDHFKDELISYFEKDKELSQENNQEVQELIFDYYFYYLDPPQRSDEEDPMTAYVLS